MKAISLRQPWADWVVQGRKTLELRNWTVNYRGPLAIHASQTVNEAACHANGIQPNTLTTGALIGVVELVEITSLDEAAFRARSGEHLADGFFSAPTRSEPLFGWKLESARELPQPIPYHGRMGLFNIPDELIISSRKPEEESSSPSDFRSTDEAWDARQPFELRVIPETQNAQNSSTRAAYRLALYQRIVEPPPAQGRLTTAAPIEMRLVAELGGSALKAVADQVLDALRGNEYGATELSLSRREPFLLSEESGVRLGLLFLAVKPISKMNRVEAISLGIRAMTSEELYYWFSKCAGQGRGNSPAVERAQKALRLLLSEE